MDVNSKYILSGRLAGRAAGVGAIPETGPIEYPCHRAFRQSRTLRFARLELGLGREDSVRYPVVPTEASRSEAQWRDLFSTICGPTAEIRSLHFAPAAL